MLQAMEQTPAQNMLADTAEIFYPHNGSDILGTMCTAEQFLLAFCFPLNIFSFFFFFTLCTILRCAC